MHLIYYFVVGFCFSLVLDFCSEYIAKREIKISNTNRVMWMALWPFYLPIFITQFFE